MGGILQVDTIQNNNTSTLITQTNATTITVGTSGQTITIPTGVTFNTTNASINYPAGSISNAAINASAAIATTKLGTGAVLQVVSTAKTDTFTTTSSTYTDATGLSVSITPSSSSNKILVSYSIQFSGIVDSYGGAVILRNGTIITQGTGGTGSQTNITTALAIGSSGNWDYKLQTAQFEILDSPATTSAITYKLQVKSTYLTRAININGPYSTDGNSYNNFGVSSITAIEIKG
jgi:hypothetical protein